MNKDISELFLKLVSLGIGHTELVRGSKFEIDSSHHHHTVFEWEGFTLENHYDFVNVHVRKSSKELEVCLRS